MAETSVDNGQGLAPPSKVWYSVEEVAERWGMKPGWVRDHATRKDPRIKVRKFGRFLRFHHSDIVEFEERIKRGYAESARNY